MSAAAGGLDRRAVQRALNSHERYLIVWQYQGEIPLLRSQERAGEQEEETRDDGLRPRTGDAVRNRP